MFSSDAGNKLNNFKILVGDSVGLTGGDECGHHFHGTEYNFTMECDDIDVGRYLTILKYGPGFSPMMHYRYANVLPFCEVLVYGSQKGRRVYMNFNKTYALKSTFYESIRVICILLASIRVIYHVSTSIRVIDIVSLIKSIRHIHSNIMLNCFMWEPSCYLNKGQP